MESLFLVGKVSIGHPPLDANLMYPLFTLITWSEVITNIVVIGRAGPSKGPVTVNRWLAFGSILPLYWVPCR